MKNLFKKATVAALAACTALSLASCGGGSSENNTIVFYHTMNDKYQEVLKTAVETFEAKYPGWKIDHRSVGGYDQVRDAIIGDLQSEAQPDMAYCYPDHVAMYMQTSKVLDLSTYINSSQKVKATVGGEETEVAVGYTADEIKAFVPGYYNEGKGENFADYEKYGYRADSMLTMPFVKSTEVLYYNADALKDSKIVEKLDAKYVKDGEAIVPTSWDELWAISRAVKAAYPKSTPLGYDSEANWVICMDSQNNWGYTSAKEPHYTFDNEQNVNFLTDLNKKYKEEKLFTTKTFYNGYTSNLFKKGYKEGSTFSIGSSGGAAHQAGGNFHWGVAPLPGSMIDGKLHKDAIQQGPSITLFKSEAENADEKQLMTWMFLKEMLEPKFQAQYSMVSGYNPANTKAFSIPAYEDFLSEKDNIKAVTAKVAKDMSEDYFVSPAFVGSSTARDQIGAAFIHAVNGVKTPAKALKDAANNCGA